MHLCERRQEVKTIQKPMTSVREKMKRVSIRRVAFGTIKEGQLQLAKRAMSELEDRKRKEWIFSEALEPR